jgi:hypothetical protein
MSKKNPTYNMLKPLEKNEQKSISVRVPIELHKRFEAIKAIAERNGYTYSLTDVVLQAMNEACDNVKEELRRKLGKDVFQKEFDV